VFALRASGFKAHQQWRRGENSKIADRSAVNNQSTGGTYPSPLFVGDGAEREGNSKSREGVSFSRSYRGGHPPRMLPHERGTPLSESPFESHPLWHCIAFVNLVSTQHCFCGGEGGIRTHGPVSQTAVFETARFGHSRTSPHGFGWLVRRFLAEYVRSRLVAGVGRRFASVPGSAVPTRRRRLRRDDSTGVHLAD
jgi:hypothetical protein